MCLLPRVINILFNVNLRILRWWILFVLCYICHLFYICLCYESWDMILFALNRNLTLKKLREYLFMFSIFNTWVLLFPACRSQFPLGFISLKPSSRMHTEFLLDTEFHIFNFAFIFFHHLSVCSFAICCHHGSCLWWSFYSSSFHMSPLYLIFRYLTTMCQAWCSLY